ncbi:alkaline phosphatase family protein [Lolliginicoccus suaedae]|uniref:alkaline phosphatase family protein n=1 Tax=Lolliginicoccus suaedae TaxID=2605429 RepID=UPI0011F01330|nr:alkaline phosphatase family protein [Lolliginicoccus suaedae]
MPPIDPSRRAVLAGMSGAIAATALARGARATPITATGSREVHVLVVDGLRVDEVTPDQMPWLSALDSSGVRYQNADAISIAETLPNHTAMMTGVRPARSGVPANSIYDRAEQRIRTIDRPADLAVPTILERLPAERGIATASVLSKDYLHGLFHGRASVQWDPAPLIPLTEHAPDQATMDALLRIHAEHSPRFTFTNLGDVDRVGHIDLTGTGLRLARAAAVRNTDMQVQRFIDHLHRTGRWDRSIVIITADHSMDWSAPLSLISMQVPFMLDPVLRDNVRIADNGGASLWYWTGDPGQRGDAIERMRRIASPHPGIESLRDPGELGLGDRAGDVVALCHAGWRFTDPTVLSNPIPGNHGHAVTTPIPMIVAGGEPRLRRGSTVTEPVSTMDIAPTVAGLFGLAAPAGGWDGSTLPGLLLD